MSVSLFQEYEVSKTFDSDAQKVFRRVLDEEGAALMITKYKDLATDEKIYKMDSKYARLIYQIMTEHDTFRYPKEVLFDLMTTNLQNRWFHNIYWACINSKDCPDEILQYVVDNPEKFTAGNVDDAHRILKLRELEHSKK
jgi:hypothetical protein